MERHQSARVPDPELIDAGPALLILESVRVFTLKETQTALPPSSLWLQELKWESFFDESTKFKKSSRYGTTTYAIL
jgi:hypothetical protein